MAAQFAKYGDLIVGFVVAQGLAFAYGLGKKGDLKTSILNAYSKVMPILFLAGITYLVLVAACGYWEYSLRDTAGQVRTVLRASIAGTVGRGVIIVIITVLCAWALDWSKRKDANVA